MMSYHSYHHQDLWHVLYAHLSTLLIIGITDLVFLLEKDHELRYRRFRDLDDQTTEHRTASDHSVILVQFVKAFRRSNILIFL